MALQEENLTLKQNSFAANISASSSSAEAEQVANAANTLLSKMVEGNESLQIQIKQMTTENNDLKTSVASLPKALAASEQTLKAEETSHHKEEDDLASQLATTQRQLHELQELHENKKVLR